MGNGDLKGVKAALESGVDVNTKGQNGWTGLMWAVRNNHTSVVKLLIKTPNIDVNTKGEYDWTVLMWAVNWNRKSVVELLLKTLMSTKRIIKTGAHYSWLCGASLQGTQTTQTTHIR